MWCRSLAFNGDPAGRGLLLGLLAHVEEALVLLEPRVSQAPWS